MLSRLGFPPIGRHRRFVTAIAIDAVGSGVWMPVSMLYFLAVTPLTLVQVGTAMSVASLLTLPLTLLVGAVVDRYGAKRVLQLGNVLQAIGFAAYPFAHALPVVVLVVAVAAAGRTAFWGSYAPMVAAISEQGERELWFGFLGALRNSGFAVGGLLAGAAITIGTGAAYQAVVVLNAVSFVASFVLMAGVVGHEEARAGGVVTGGWGVVLRDRGYRWLLGSNFGYAMTGMALNVAMPVYIVRMLHLPGWVSGAVFVVNTVLIGVGQGLVVRAMTGRTRSRIVVLAAGFSASSFLMLLGAGRLAEAAAVTVVLLAAVVYTLGEMTGGPVLSTLAAESSPLHLRGRFLATYQLSWNASSTVAPVLFAWLLGLGATEAWVTLAAVAGAGAACCLPMHRLLPLAARPVTNRASGTAVVGDVAGETVA
ncbi:MAG TPA: MFS transporter [Marmoricola sp.]|nr:MFS transporter [Marmoricola sp.]